MLSKGARLILCDSVLSSTPLRYVSFYDAKKGSRNWEKNDGVLLDRQWGREVKYLVYWLSLYQWSVGGWDWVTLEKKDEGSFG